MSYADHGHRHKPGGSDEIPGMDPRAYPSPYQPLDVLLSDALGFDLNWGVITIDSTKYGGGYRGQSGTPAIGNWVAFPFRAGPVGSVWGVTMVCRTGPDFGQVGFKLATSSENGLAGAVGNVGNGFMQEPYDVTFVTRAGTTEDAYTVAPAADRIVQRTAQFRVGGNSGAVLSSFSTDADGELAGDGGPGLMWLRVEVTGKHASSSGYKFDIQYVAVERVPGG